MAPRVVPRPMPMKVSPDWAMVKPRRSMKIIGKASNTIPRTSVYSDRGMRGGRERRTAVHNAVDEREVDGDEDEDGLAR